MRPLPPTAGDWFAEFDPEQAPGWAVMTRLADGHVETLAAVFDGPDLVPLEAAAANANLMAAGPRLVAACRRAVQFLRVRARGQDLRDLVADLELAIALAEPTRREEGP